MHRGRCPRHQTEPRSWISKRLDGRTAHSAAGPAREFLWEIGGGFGSVALTGLLGSDGFLARQAVAADGVDAVHEPAGAQGPALARRRPRASSSCSCTAARATSIRSTTSRTSTRSTARRSPSRRSAAAARRTRAGSSGPSGRSASTASAASGSPTCSRNLATCVDDIAFIHSMYAESPIHGSAMLMMNSGRLLCGQPLPGHLGHLRPGERKRKPAGLRGDARPDRRPDQRGEELVERLHAGGLPGDGAPLRRHADPRPGLAGGHPTARPGGCLLDRLREKNEDHLAARADNSELAARIASYELAFKMQQLGARGRRLRQRVARDPGALRHRPARARPTSAASA